MQRGQFAFIHFANANDALACLMELQGKVTPVSAPAAMDLRLANSPAPGSPAAHDPHAAHAFVPTPSKFAPHTPGQLPSMAMHSPAVAGGCARAGAHDADRGSPALAHPPALRPPPLSPRGTCSSS